MSAVSPAVGSRRSGSEPALVGCLVLVVVVVGLISSLGAPLVPEIAADRGVSVRSAQWSVTVAMLVGAVAAPVLGRLGDGPHRRRVVLAALAVVTTGCLLAAVPLGFAGLLAGRAMQGVGVGMMPLGIAIARDHLQPLRAAPAVPLLSVTTVAGAGLGYPVSGALAELGGVEASFAFGAAVAGAALLLAVLVLPPGGHLSPVPFDLPGAVLLAVALTSVLTAVSEAAAWGWGSPAVLGLLGVAGCSAVLWTRHELHRPQPLVQLRLLRHREVLLADLTGLAAGVGVYLLLSAATRLLRTPRDEPDGLAASVFVTASAMVPFAVVSLATAQLAPRLLRGRDAALLLPVGCVLFGAAMGLFLTARHDVALVFATMALAGLGAGCTFAAMPGLIVRAVPPSEVGSAVGFNQVARTIGYATGSALSAALLSAYGGSADGFPAAAGYDAAAVTGLVVVLGAAAASVVPRRRPPTRSAAAPDTDDAPTGAAHPLP
ncbi:MFS transporter [Geodermatophilus sp. TF02-6]|uniref:MFS transporter n=1 Tax=Geodermatophilus sp. TF02-6 TaxID=2250575 RepID=UPI000DEAD5A8|nr:MFS transporter [Geodermatophilus sp. TF02-6]RBY83685.1 MFS transporter [Geodermatophilus sp. TF02-6]